MNVREKTTGQTIENHKNNGGLARRRAKRAASSPVFFLRLTAGSDHRYHSWEPHAQPLVHPDGHYPGLAK